MEKGRRKREKVFELRWARDLDHEEARQGLEEKGEMRGVTTERQAEKAQSFWHEWVG